MRNAARNECGFGSSYRHLVERVLAVHEARFQTVPGGLSETEQMELERFLVRLEKHLDDLLVQSRSTGAG